MEQAERQQMEGGPSISTLHPIQLQLFSKLAHSYVGPQETGPVVLR